MISFHFVNSTKSSHSMTYPRSEEGRKSEQSPIPEERTKCVQPHLVAHNPSTQLFLFVFSHNLILSIHRTIQRARSLQTPSLTPISVKVFPSDLSSNAKIALSYRVLLRRLLTILSSHTDYVQHDKDDPYTQLFDTCTLRGEIRLLWKLSHVDVFAESVVELQLCLENDAHASCI